MSLNDMQFADEEEKLLQWKADEAAAEYAAEEAADFEAFMAEEAEHDAHNEAMREHPIDKLLDAGIATCEEVAEIAAKYGVE